MSIHGVCNAQRPVHRLGVGFIHQTTTDVIQKLTHLGFTNIKHAGLQRTPVIKRHARRQLHELGFQLWLPVGIHRFRSQPDVEFPGRPFFDRLWCLMWSCLAAGRPDHQNPLPFMDFWREYRLIYRIDDVTASPYPSLGVFNLFFRKSFDRKDGGTVLFSNTKGDVTAVQVLKVVCKCADCPNDLGARGFLIPRRLKIDASRFNALQRQQIIDVDGKYGRHNVNPHVIRRRNRPAGLPPPCNKTSCGYSLASPHRMRLKSSRLWPCGAAHSQLTASVDFCTSRRLSPMGSQNTKAASPWYPS